MAELSVIIPARNEIFLQKTIENILENIEADTEIIAVCDGYWPDPPVRDHERVNIIHFTKPVGQRAATNAGARLSQAKYVMKCDAHCAFDKGFDRKLIADCQPDWTMVPAMFNLHAFDWMCKNCGFRSYQGPKPKVCSQCNQESEHEMVIVWRRRKARLTIAWRFDSDMHFQYWKDYKNRPEAQGKIIDTMSFIGACWFMFRDRYWELEGLDEKHGFWGQVGTEVACKSWLSGGRLCTTKKTWFAHMFRTKNDGFSFPYQISGRDIQRARDYSIDLWKNNKWPKQKYDLQWLVDKFSPVPGWDNSLEENRVLAAIDSI
ncbi:MAG TPA: glycosyltransferase family 2 protein [Candidatus Syntrophosphaera sp.]|jgi:glycosyltransferase involved in cell wall biosynthesis|nr:glycosyltransferase family 2 protein [Candidatus Syntrophosphaera sp.]